MSWRRGPVPSRTGPALVATQLVDVPVHELVIGADHPPGLHLPAVLSLVDGSRCDDRPLEVRALRGGRYEITNGRHRYVAAVIAGRSHLPCEVRPLEHPSKTEA